MRLLIAGSKRWEHVESVRRQLYALEPTVLIHGGDDGACSIADTIARMRLCIPVVICKKDPFYGKRAGLVRNAAMLSWHSPDRGLALGSLWWFKPGGATGAEGEWRPTGTGDMVARMLRAGLPVRWICAPGAEAIDLVEMPTPDEQEQRKAMAQMGGPRAAREEST